MIDVDARGRAAADDLHRATAEVADTDAALVTLLGGTQPVALGSAPDRRRRAPAAVLVGAVAAALALVVVLVAGRPGGSPDAPAGTLPAPSDLPVPAPTGSAAPTDPPRPTDGATVPGTVAAPTTLGPGPVSDPPPHQALHVLASVASAGDLPQVVAARSPRRGMPATELFVGDVRVPTASAAILAVQAPDGVLLVDDAGDAADSMVDPVEGDMAIPGDTDASDGKRVSSIGDVATVGGVPTLVAVRAYPCNTEGARCGGAEPALIALDGSGPVRTVISIGGTEPVAAGRFSLSDTGLVAGVGQFGADARVGILIDTTIEPDAAGPSAIDVGRSIGLNGVATSDPARRVDAVTVDQSGRAAAWLDAAGITVVDLTTGERRTFPLIERPGGPMLPVLDLALAGDSIADGAVLLSAIGEPAHVVDLTDGSVEVVPDFFGTLTFGARR